MKDYFDALDPKKNIHNGLPVARPGLIFILSLTVLVLLALTVRSFGLAAIIFLATLFTAWFFRDPARPTPPTGFGLSPADGRVIKIECQESNPFIDGPAWKISIFMSIFNVHINRTPLDGRLTRQIYCPGTFFNASLDKANKQNERNALILETDEGPIAVVQIAGLIARRIVSWVGEGDWMERGQRFGLIRFGSRLDLYLPAESEIMVVIGQHLQAGWSPVWRRRIDQ